MQSLLQQLLYRVPLLPKFSNGGDEDKYENENWDDKYYSVPMTSWKIHVCFLARS